MQENISTIKMIEQLSKLSDEIKESMLLGEKNDYKYPSILDVDATRKFFGRGVDFKISEGSIVQIDVALKTGEHVNLGLIELRRIANARYKFSGRSNPPNLAPAVYGVFDLKLGEIDKEAWMLRETMGLRAPPWVFKDTSLERFLSLHGTEIDISGINPDQIADIHLVTLLSHYPPGKEPPETKSFRFR